jgi:hypothetical protein
MRATRACGRGSSRRGRPGGRLDDRREGGRPPVDRPRHLLDRPGESRRSRAPAGSATRRAPSRSSRPVPRSDPLVVGSRGRRCRPRRARPKEFPRSWQPAPGREQRRHLLEAWEIVVTNRRLRSSSSATSLERPREPVGRRERRRRSAGERDDPGEALGVGHRVPFYPMTSFRNEFVHDLQPQRRRWDRPDPRA